MIVTAVVALGALVGGVAIGTMASRVRTRGVERSPAPETVRWERTGGTGMTGTLAYMRRHYPTHDFVAGARMHDLVTPLGVDAAAVTRATSGWTFAAVMIDRRTGEIARIVIGAEDAHAETKRAILRRVGLRATTLAADAGQDEIRTALAA